MANPYGVMSADFNFRYARKLPCRKCGAAAGEPCVSLSQRTPGLVLDNHHGERMWDANKVTRRKPASSVIIEAKGFIRETEPHPTMCSEERLLRAIFD